MTKKEIIIKISCVVGIILAVLAIYFGSYLPFTKAHRYIDALRYMQSGNVKSVQDFEATFNKAFQFFSPIGNEEVAKFLANDILGLISQKEQPEEVSRALVGYIEPYMNQSNVRHLLSLGQMYVVLWQQYHHDEDFSRAEGYYAKAHAIGPALPPVLYGLLDLYVSKGDKIHIQQIQEIILGYWDDPRIEPLK